MITGLNWPISYMISIHFTFIDVNTDVTSLWGKEHLIVAQPRFTPARGMSPERVNRHNNKKTDVTDECVPKLSKSIRKAEISDHPNIQATRSKLEEAYKQHTFVHANLVCWIIEFKCCVEIGKSNYHCLNKADYYNPDGYFQIAFLSWGTEFI